MKHTLSLVISLALLSGASPNQTYSQKNIHSDAYFETFRQISAAGKNHDRGGLLALCATLKERYPDESDLYNYARLMVRACAALRTDFGKSERPEIVRKADEAIQHMEDTVAGEIPAELLVEYWTLQVSYLGSKYGASNYWVRDPYGTEGDDVWEDKRREIAERTVLTLGRIERALNPAWVEDIRIPLKVSPPNGAPAGASPESIADPILREQYKAEIQKNQTVMLWWGAQRDLRVVQRMALENLVEAASEMYSQEPMNIEELSDLLTSNRISKRVREEVMKAVEARKAAREELMKAIEARKAGRE